MTRIEHAPRRWIPVDGADIAVIETGSGKPTVFLHGVPETADIWCGVMSRLGDRMRCLAPDLPGFGLSGVPQGFDPSFAGLATFVGELLEAEGVTGKVNLVAHDFGGAFAMAFASQQPDRVDRVVVMSQPFFVGRYRWHLDARAFRTPVLGEIYVRGALWPAFFLAIRRTTTTLSTQQIRTMYRRVTPAARRMVLQLYRAASPDAFRRWEPRMLDATADIPTLAITGDDPYIPSALVHEIGAARTRYWPECGHWLPTEVPGRVADEISEWLTPAANQK